MELLDAIEELEQPAHSSRCSPPLHDYDCVERQVLFVQRKLRDVWQRKRGSSTEIPRIPFNWVFSKLLRLIEEYPDGLTEAVVVTEMVKLLKQKEAEQDVGASSKKRKIRDEEDMGDLLAEAEQEALHAKVTGYGNHRLTIEMENVKDVTAHMYLHQRFRSCMDFLHRNLQYEPSAATFPFQTGREVAFTNAKLLERKEVDMGSMDGENRVKFTLLPTGFLTAQLDEKRPLDRRLLADSISLSRVDQLASGHQDPSVIQQLMLKAKVLDIGAIRPCQTPMYVHRQVILLGEADETKVPRIPLGATPNTQRMTQGLHLMVLWDDQVALSRLFRVGDTLSIFHPFVHVCDQHDTEILHILNEYSSQQRLMYYFEYGSATVLFCQPCRIATTKSPIKNRPVSQGPSEIERPLSRLADIKPGWRNFSLYAHVRNIKVSHGIPLLAAFFYAYYDPKTNQSGAMNSSMQQPPPPLDRTIVSKYYLVVMLQVYLPSSKRLMTIEITGENALIALRLVPGQSVFLDGLVAIDMKSKPVRRFRERALMPSASLTASAPVEFAFPTKTYSNSSDSGVVVLCSDWASIFGKQSLFSTNSNLTVVNTTPGLMNTVLDQSKALDNASAHALKMVEMTVTGAGWLIPSSNGYTIDSTCEKGHSTTCAHKFCLRSLETIPREQRAAAPPKWKCSFCQEVFFGMEDTVQTYQDLAVTVETGKSQTSPLILLCQGDTVENLLGLPAEDYVQLSLAEKRKTLDSVTGSAFRLMLSRCEALHVSLATTPSPSSPRSFDTSSSIDFRMDMAQLVDTFAAAHQLLATLGFQTDQAF